ncbi:TIGR04086 family membrane protein [Tissierella creatinophila]|uniref:TIGR04086 family membrane protein n=1 Tax=Tissierella creatinophila DSM 6911 TaxID=1123403 RepID=A0A1U7M344_TISCR|nr:TIGR04086 family membrane protein [Tissierella creatinophila]OLS01670.1 hypothetical protein TICRE_22700 [Tissierella creatinophila DSM 6911]
MKNKLNVKFLAKALFLSFCITIFMILVSSLIFQFTTLRETKMVLINNIIMVISIFIPSLYLALKVKENGWLNGFLLGFVYYVVIILLNIFLFKSNITLTFSLGKLLLTSLIGTIGGIIGINLS